VVEHSFKIVYSVGDRQTNYQLAFSCFVVMFYRSSCYCWLVKRDSQEGWKIKLTYVLCEICFGLCFCYQSSSIFIKVFLDRSIHL